MSGSNSLAEGESLRRVHSTGDITTNRRQQSRIGTLNTADNLPPILPALVPSSPSRTSTGSRVDTVPTIGSLQDIAPTVPTISEDFDFRNPRETSTGHRSSTQRRSGRITPTSLFKSVYTFLGYGPNNRARKELVSLIRSGIWSLLQVAFICAFVAYSAVHTSPTSAPFTEWRACDRPLGAWNCIWLFRVIFGFCMSVWSWRRERKSRSLESSRSRSSTITDVESGRRTHNSARSPPSTRRARTATASELSNANQNSTVSKSTRMYNRLTLLLSLLTMTWFLIAHIFIYTSIQTCRFSSPHLWWLSFGIVSILYLMVLEVICIALVVFIVCPIAFLLWNILLLILGRHPLQHSHYAKPEGKISKAVVERLPLVLYIPPPPEETEKATVSFPVPVYNPKSGHTYPPATPAPNKRRHIFKFIRTKRSKRRTEAKAEDTTDVKVQSSDAKKNFGSWEDNWEAAEYPFVRLEGNRATCAICLMDFEEPKKSSKYTDISSSPEEVSHVRATEQDNNAIVVSTIDESNDESGLHLEDAGEGAQPLRLLPCGHVFHKTCVDPWLLDVSGRCPTCQQAVEPKANKKAKRRRSR